MSQLLLGLDVGSSAVKACLLDVETGRPVAQSTSPETGEMRIEAPASGFAEQDPEIWWQHVQKCVSKFRQKAKLDQVVAIGIAYQMHGMVLVDEKFIPVRPSIIWCDSRSAEIGKDAFESLGEIYCLKNFLNSPGNFTASKLSWVKQFEPENFSRSFSFMLPGDYIALKLSARPTTTTSGLSEGILWNYPENRLASELLSHYGLPEGLIPDVLPTFSSEVRITDIIAKQLGLPSGIPVSYRAGDQPNNAFALAAIQPGDFAASAGTSGVVYGVGSQASFDPHSLVNTFLHVNHQPSDPRLGTLLCINGTGSLNRWLKNLFGAFQSKPPAYEQLNMQASSIPPGSEGLQIFPYGNGAERSLGDRFLGGQLRGIDFNRHESAHVLRAAQEGIVFAFRYGMEIMSQMGVSPHVIRACDTSMFRSRLFCQIFSDVTGCQLELYQTDGAEGAARGAGVGVGLYSSIEQAFAGLERVVVFEPKRDSAELYSILFHSWNEQLKASLMYS